MQTSADRVKVRETPLMGTGDMKDQPINQKGVKKENLLELPEQETSAEPVQENPTEHSGDREFKKSRQQLQRKRDIKIELCIKVSLLLLFQVGHVVEIRRSALSLAWHEWFSCKGKE